MTPAQLIGQNVERLRKEKDYTQEELAKELQRKGLRWTQSHVSRAERGGYNAVLRIDVLVIIADALLVTLPELLEGTGRVTLGHTCRMSVSGFRAAVSARIVP